MNMGLTWMARMPHYVNGGCDTLDAALSAMCLTRLGKTNDDERLVAKSVPLYSKALAGLSRRLRNKNTAMDNETLMACMALTKFEVSFQNWAFHWRQAKLTYEGFQCRGGTSAGLAESYSG